MVGVLQGKPARPWWQHWKFWAGIAAAVLSALVFVLLNPETPRLAIFWLFGLAFGFVLQRSRFCFVSAISNFALFRDGRLLKGLLAGLILATVGFSVIMFSSVPDPSSGVIPVSAHVAPLGWHLIIGGVLFGLGMMLAGGCIMGNLYRLGEGSLSALLALFGVLIGLGALLLNWPWWWRNLVSSAPQVWLPASLGWAGAISVTLAVLAGLLWLILKLESKRQAPSLRSCFNLKAMGGWLKNWCSNIFVTAWPLALGGVVLALLNVLEYQLVDRPWGITGEVMRWSEIMLNTIGLAPPPVTSVPGT
jgi:hypothetical protein